VDLLARKVYLLAFPRTVGGGEGDEQVFHDFVRLNVPGYEKPSRQGEAAAMREKELSEAWEQLRLAADCGHVVAAQCLVDDQGEAGAAGGGSQKQARPAHNTECRTQQDREELVEEGERGREGEREGARTREERHLASVYVKSLEESVEKPHEQLQQRGDEDFPTMTIALPPALTRYRLECPVQVRARLSPLL